MALLPAVLPTSKTTITVADYAAATLTLSAMLAQQQRPPIARTYDTNEVMTNSATGKDLYATPFNGLAPGQTFQLSHKNIDPKNDTDATTPVSFFRALVANVQAGTGYAAWTLTSQLTGLGKRQFKMIYVQRGEDGTSHTTTVPCIAMSMEAGESDGSEDFTVTLLVVGAITVA